MLIDMLKRDMRLFCRCLAAALLFALIFGAIGFGTAVAVGSGGSDMFQQPEVAVVDKENSMLSRMVIGFVEESDFVAPLFRVTKAKEKEALRRFAEGTCSAVILLPENFLEDISYGRQSNGQILISESIGAYSYVVEAAARFGERMLAAGQYGVFSGEHLIRDYGRSAGEHEQFLLAVNTQLLNEVLESNNRYYEFVMTDYDKTSLSAENYYLTAWIAFVLTLTGLFFWKLYKTDLNSSVYTRLLSYGMKDWQFSAGKLLYPLGFQMVLLLIGFVLLPGRIEFSIGVGTVTMLLLALIVTDSMAFAFAVSMRNEVIITTSIAFLGLLLCGGVIPRTLLPDAVAVAGDLMPVGVVRALLTPCFGGNVSWYILLAAVSYLLLFAVMIRSGLKKLKTGGIV